MGLTLDVGHMMAAGENPAASVALVAAAKRLWGVQLGDGHARGEDGLMLGAVHPVAALELAQWLQKTGCVCEGSWARTACTCITEVPVNLVSPPSHLASPEGADRLCVSTKVQNSCTY